MAGAYTVTQVTSYIRNMFTQDFALNRISIRGEVSNCKYHTSGHIYFTLKDSGAQIAAVMFAGQRDGLDFQLAEGQEVTVTGSVDVYERDGRYQLYAKKITREGRGGLYLKFEQLRNELEEMGMFDSCYKQPIPKYARSIGIVTASTGAAIRDIMNIASRRNPYVQLVLYPALVQGEQAKYSIAKGIETLDQMGLDLLIVGRGCGSIEDIWAFNEELVARAIFNCNTPIISAVGHETDVTIADYVADLRAPTPSAAAELAVFDYGQFVEQTALYHQVLQRSMERRVERLSFRLNQDCMRLKLLSPKHQLNDRRQRLADIEGYMRDHIERRLQKAEQQKEEALRLLSAKMEQALTRERHRLAILGSRLDGLSPLKKLGGGYGFITDEREQALRSVTQACPGESITVRVRDGRMEARVEKIEKLRYGLQ